MEATALRARGSSRKENSLYRAQPSKKKKQKKNNSVVKIYSRSKTFTGNVWMHLNLPSSNSAPCDPRPPRLWFHIRFLSPSLLLSLSLLVCSLARHPLGFRCQLISVCGRALTRPQEIKEGTAKVCDYYRTNGYINLIGTRVVAFCSSHFKWSAWQTAGPGEGLAADKWEDQSEKKGQKERWKELFWALCGVSKCETLVRD